MGAASKHRSIAGGGGHTLALLENGTVKAFGGNLEKQCEVPNLGGRKCISLAAGGLHSLLLLDDGSVQAFGNNSLKQCQVPDLQGHRCISVAAGGTHSLLLLDDFTVKAFGDNSSKQCEVPDLRGRMCISIAAGRYHSLLLFVDGTVEVFGSDAEKQCQVPDLRGRRCIKIAGGDGHSMLLLDDGSVEVFGSNFEKQCEVPDLHGRKVISIAAGWFHSLLLLQDGTVEVFGSNCEKQCQVPNLAGRKCIDMDAGDSHSLLLLEDFSLQVFGDNRYEQCQVPDLLGLKIYQSTVDANEEGKPNVMILGKSGRGKSAIANALVYPMAPCFESCSSLFTVTEYFKVVQTERCNVVDTTNIAVADKRHGATALPRIYQDGGWFKNVFVVGSCNGRIIEEDLEYINVVQRALPNHAQKQYGIVINQCVPELLEELKTNEDTQSKFEQMMLLRLPPTRHIEYIPLCDDLLGSANVAWRLPSELDDFFQNVPAFHLKPGEVEPIPVESPHEVDDGYLQT
eukprot:TRINITY_DN27957_c0_g1_i1.p1 TRINITY_DN27957_c0_g1~~TRINITY_DN27957_c0_g1_i1.p1  ORF type:complete len:512 (-),score=107.45 TRINITY_DN27957_c0_g1_i1:411-1946(-)